MFDVHQFFSRSNWPLFRPAAGLTPDSLYPFTYMNKANSKSLQDAVPGFGGGVMK
jgi:hypothetical protein